MSRYGKLVTLTPCLKLQIENFIAAALCLGIVCTESLSSENAALVARPCRRPQ